MGYYDGNTVTALWNWAQHYALSDNFYGTMFGPSTVGVLNLVGGSTTHFTAHSTSSLAGTMAGGSATGTLIGDIDAGNDDCGSATSNGTTTDPNIGLLLNAKSDYLGMVSRRVCSHHPLQSPGSHESRLCLGVQ